ncbi:MAG: helix-turn-helix domain-containing protein [bacterium]|nr:helix-turn-helix domain-containing protein [bacterium]
MVEEHSQITDRRPTIMTVKEVAKYLRMHMTSVYRLAKAGILPAHRVGGSWRFKKAEIEEWLKNRSNIQPVNEINQ